MVSIYGLGLRYLVRVKPRSLTESQARDNYQRTPINRRDNSCIRHDFRLDTIKRPAY